MPIVKYGSIITSARGSMQGTSFSRCSAGDTIFRKPLTVNKRTNLQNIQRQRFYYLCNYWRTTLTTLQRLFWDAYASTLIFTNRLGDPFHISGFNLFIKTNMFYYLSMGVVVQTAVSQPGFASVLLPNTSMISVTGTINRLTLSPAAFCGFDETNTSNVLLCYAFPQTVEHNKFNDKYKKFIGFSKGAGGGGGYNPSTLTIPWTCTAGKYIRLLFKHLDQYNRFWEETIIQKLIS